MMASPTVVGDNQGNREFSPESNSKLVSSSIQGPSKSSRGRTIEKKRYPYAYKQVNKHKHVNIRENKDVNI